jgi:hypothetical protein
MKEARSPFGVRANGEQSLEVRGWTLMSLRVR